MTILHAKIHLQGNLEALRWNLESGTARKDTSKMTMPFTKHPDQGGLSSEFQLINEAYPRRAIPKAEKEQ